MSGLPEEMKSGAQRAIADALRRHEALCRLGAADEAEKRDQLAAALFDDLIDILGMRQACLQVDHGALANAFFAGVDWGNLASNSCPDKSNAVMALMKAANGNVNPKQLGAEVDGILAERGRSAG